MLKKKISGSWSNISTLKKKVNGAWSYITTLKKKNNGSWVDVFFNWFNIVKYTIDSGCVGTISTSTNSHVSAYNYIEYGNNCNVEVVLGKFNAIAGDTITIEYSYDLYPYSTGNANAYALINYNVSSSSTGNSVTTIFNQTASYTRQTATNTFNYTFTSNYSNVGIHVRINNWSTGTSRGAVESTVKLLNIYINGARINYADATIS